MVTLRFLIVATCVALAACSSSVDRSVQQPGDPSMSGLQVPPDMWARPGQPTQQTASLPAR